MFSYPGGPRKKPESHSKKQILGTCSRRAIQRQDVHLKNRSLYFQCPHHPAVHLVPAVPLLPAVPSPPRCAVTSSCSVTSHFPAVVPSPPCNAVTFLLRHHPQLCLLDPQLCSHLPAGNPPWSPPPIALLQSIAASLFIERGFQSVGACGGQTSPRPQGCYSSCGLHSFSKGSSKEVGGGGEH